MKKTPKAFKEAHSANKKFGMGDHYGTGIKNPVGKLRDEYLGAGNLKPNKLKTPPKSLA